MNSVNLSNRLQVVADYVDEGARLADIGSDHAYLPCYLAQTDRITFAVAGEVVEGPYLNAVKEVKKLGLEDTVDVRLGDGLRVLDGSDQISTITIAGVGGPLIKRILEEGKQLGKRTGRETLVLQPNVNEWTVRQYLMSESYKITDETIIEENDKIYEIIKAEPSASVQEYSERDLLFGPFLREDKSAVFIKKWTSEADKTRYIIDQMEKADQKDEQKINTLHLQLNLIKEMIE